MRAFTKHSGLVGPMDRVNVDTDMIIPKQFLKTIKRTGLGKNLFFEMRYDDKGKQINSFVLNQEPYNKSKILIAGKNFCLLYTSPSPRDRTRSRMPSSA